MKRFLPCALMILIALCPLTALSSAPEDDTIELGAFPGAFVSPEGFVPGPGLEWWMPVEDFIETMPHPEQLDPEHPRYTQNTYTLYRGSNGTVSPYEEIVFSNIDHPFMINYHFDNAHNLRSVSLRAGTYEHGATDEEATLAWETFTPIAAQVLQQLYAYHGEEKSLDELEALIRKGITEHTGIRAVWEDTHGTYFIMAADWASPGVTIILGPSEWITPDRTVEKLWLP